LSSAMVGIEATAGATSSARIARREGATGAERETDLFIGALNIASQPPRDKGALE